MEKQCQNCIFWDRSKDYDTSTGTCELQFKVKNLPSMWADCGENTIRTSEDFSCIRFSSKSASEVLS